MSRTDMVVASRDVLAKHSRSFSWAAQFLPESRRNDAAVVYAMCRTIDDLADEAECEQRAEEELDRLRGELRGRRDPRPLVEAFFGVAERCGLDVAYALELVDGVESDLGEVCLEDDRQLLRYCYRVAGTVGLMMCAVLGVEEAGALPHAVDLGMAMQLTNICRDVREDASRGRVYLPRTRLERVGVSTDEILGLTAAPGAVATVVGELLEMADRYYRSADCGMAYIPTRSRVGIVVASRVYRAIGVHLRLRGGDALAGRTVVPPAAKVWWVLIALGACLSPTISGMWSPDEHDASLHWALHGLPGV